MNGAGTKENPYIIMNADDLYAMETTGNNQAYFALGANIDFNDTQYAENFVPVPLNCKMFSGNGHVIRNVNYNISAENASMFTVSGADENTSLIVEGLRIENIRLAGKDVFIFGNNGGKCSISLKHCIFVMNDMTTLTSTQCEANDRHCLIHDNNITVSADYCTFVINAYFHRMYALFSEDKVSHTQMRIEINTNILSGTGDSYNAIFSGTDVSDSYAFITIRSSDSGSIDLSSSYSSFNRSYFVIEPAENISTVYWYGHIGSICFYDREVLTKNNKETYVLCNKDYASLIYGLSTASCKNAVYLRSIGFNCLEADK